MTLMKKSRFFAVFDCDVTILRNRDRSRTRPVIYGGDTDTQVAL